jgi:CBS domain containing-hemolysin-like protein
VTSPTSTTWSSKNGSAYAATWWSTALTTLDDFAEKTGLVLPQGPYDTLAGFFMAQLGQLPGVGDAISLELASIDPEDEELAQVELRVSELDGRRGRRPSWCTARMERSSHR